MMSKALFLSFLLLGIAYGMDCNNVDPSFGEMIIIDAEDMGYDQSFSSDLNDADI